MCIRDRSYSVRDDTTTPAVQEVPYFFAQEAYSGNHGNNGTLDQHKILGRQMYRFQGLVNLLWAVSANSPVRQNHYTEEGFLPEEGCQ